jgi:hypothetical protein
MGQDRVNTQIEVETVFPVFGRNTGAEKHGLDGDGDGDGLVWAFSHVIL